MIRTISTQVNMMTSSRRTIPAGEHDEVDKIAGEPDDVERRALQAGEPDDVE